MEQQRAVFGRQRLVRGGGVDAVGVRLQHVAVGRREVRVLAVDDAAQVDHARVFVRRRS